MTVHRIKLSPDTALQVAPRVGHVHLQVTVDYGTCIVRRPIETVLTVEQTAALIFALEQSLEEIDQRNAAVGFIPA